VNFETRHAGRQEDAAEDQRADHAVEQHAVLVLPGDLEVPEDQGEDEQVVDRQALLQQPRGRELDPGVRPERQAHDEGEHQGEPDPQGAPPGGLPEADHVGVAVREQVDGEYEQDHGGEGRPGPHRGTSSTRGSSGQVGGSGSRGCSI